jgi:tetratricopeptide (TPR) repeat protein
MVRRINVLGVLPAAAFAQTAGSAAPKSVAPEENSYSSEPYVIEQLQTKVRFEADGRGERELKLRVRIQSESALKNFGVLVYPYMASFENLDVLYVRVRKADGSVIETPASEIQELDSAVSREAPMYTDQREKHIAVKSLGVGDILEASVRWTVHDPLAPGHFWYDDNFVQSGICLSEDIEISVPSGIALKVTGSKMDPVVREEGGRRIYSFHSSHLQKEPEEEIPEWEKNFYGAQPPKVRLSSFTSWGDVGAWYGGLQQTRVQVTPEIRAKAEELIKGKSTETEKIRAIYDYVSLRFRYIGIDLGMGRYTPHAAEDVLTNRYGDCKDKHTLFETLLEAVGIQAYPALISSAYKLDPSMPSPSLFDHVITAIPQGDSYLFLDTTSEVAPFGLLLLQLRGHEALVIPSNAPAKLVRTPVDPPFLDYEKYKMDASINSQGTLDGKARFEDRGDSEVLFRTIFRNTAQNQWKDLAQGIVGRLGFAGTVSDIDASPPESTSNPFWFSYAYHRTDYSDWKEHRITLPFPPLILLELSDKERSSKEPLPLGTPQEITYETSLKLPEGIRPSLQGNTDKKTDFAEYSASYSFDKGVLRGTRRLAIKAREVPGAEREAWSAFVRSVEEDENRYILLTGDFDAGSPFRKSRELLHEGKTLDAVAVLEKAAADDPENKQIKLALGEVYLRVPDGAKAMAQFQQALGDNPDADTLNTVAYELADANQNLKLAGSYARQAVTETSAQTMKAPLESASQADYARMGELAGQWDTLGWVKFRAGDLNAAERYLHSAWLLSQDPVIGEHLVEVYEKTGKRQSAARVCRMALATPGASVDTETKKKLLAEGKRLGIESETTTVINGRTYPTSGAGGMELSELRSVHVSVNVDLHGEAKNATFAIALENGHAGAQAQFLSGDEELRPAEKALANAKFDQPFPDEVPARILRRGILSCSIYTKTCMFVLFPPEFSSIIVPRSSD